ncbi:hypothetical protein BY996DRAFT_6423210 [Phakopsora pachyrhizi]|nr:hypothetical protein BY996DRAFT_6423210 [Phakopsora pachyrhizi]
MVSMIAELECSIVKSQSEYASLIRETETMKNDMAGVQTKVDWSIKLLESLESEKAQWEAGSATFDAHMSTIAVNVLLSSAFMTYGGFFDQSYHEAMWHGWVDHLNQAGLKYKPELSLAEFFSTADD